ncbi:MAG: CRISPR-associated protein Cas4 [Desulfotomaculales bacterium]
MSRLSGAIGDGGGNSANLERSAERSFFLNAGDIKQFFYCPRIIYFTYVLPVERKMTVKMAEGAQAHLEAARLEGRRTLKAFGLAEGTRFFRTALVSARLGLKGVLDMHIASPAGYFPVEFKDTNRPLAAGHKYQLAAYVLLLEDHYGKPVRGGFVYFLPRNTLRYVEVTPGMRLYVKGVLGKIRRLVERQTFPEATLRRGRCRDCEYRNYCGDVR